MTNYIFHRDSKWWTFEGELPVKPDPERYLLKHTYEFDLKTYNIAISDLMDSAVEVVNIKDFTWPPDFDKQCVEHNGTKFYQWPGTVEKNQGPTFNGTHGFHKEVAHLVLPKQEKMKTERFNKPTSDQILEFAIVFNDGKVEREKLADMLGLCTMIIDRLYDNGDILIKSQQEIKDETP